MSYKIKVDRGQCIGSASCVGVAPNAFDLDDEGKAVIKKKRRNKNVRVCRFFRYQ